MRAVVIFNLGGPTSLKDVKGFLFNLFYDPFILRIPNPFRYMLARLISTSREKEARSIYQKLGGGSPIVEQTLKQKEALKKELGADYNVYICMRYWHPSIKEVIKKIKNKNYKEIILLPLYPQFSTTTTESFFNEWGRQAKKLGLTTSVRKVCCYPAHPNFISAYQDLINKSIDQNNIPENTRFLFSAHGLPEKIVKSGDPYPLHVDKTVQSILKGTPKVKDWGITYQSKVGPLKWLEPSTDDEVKKAAHDKKPVAIIPISFVSEHSETLYELDILYKEMALEEGASAFYRISTVQEDLLYMKCLADLVKNDTFEPCNVTNCRKRCIT